MKISCLGYDTIDWKFITGVLEEHDASFLRVVQEEIGNKLPVNTMFQKTAVFINNAVKTSHHTNYMFSRLFLDFCSLMTRTEMVLKMLPFRDLIWLLTQEYFIQKLFSHAPFYVVGCVVLVMRGLDKNIH